jgi:hypothetical protein
MAAYIGIGHCVAKEMVEVEIAGSLCLLGLLLVDGGAKLQ